MSNKRTLFSIKDLQPPKDGQKIRKSKADSGSSSSDTVWVVNTHHLGQGRRVDMTQVCSDETVCKKKVMSEHVKWLEGKCIDDQKSKIGSYADAHAMFPHRYTQPEEPGADTVAPPFTLCSMYRHNLPVLQAMLSTLTDGKVVILPKREMVCRTAYN